MRHLRIVPEQTNINFFRYWKVFFFGSVGMMVVSVVVFLLLGLNFGIDFRGGTTIRSESSQPLDVGAYRSAIAPLGLGDVSIAEVFDAGFDTTRNVAMIRVQAQDDTGSMSPTEIAAIEAVLKEIDPDVRFASVESVGPKVSGELVRTAVIAVMLAILGIGFYVWMRFEWQFSVGAVIGLTHDAILTIGMFSLLQIRFDLPIIAAILAIVGYSINDKVVIFDRVRENLGKYKKRPLLDILNLSINETLSRTLMTSGTTLIALIALLVLGGDVLRSFVFAICWGVVIGTYSSVFMAAQSLIFLGVKREWGKPATDAGTQFADGAK